MPRLRATRLFAIASPRGLGAIFSGVLDQISTQSVAAFSLRRLRGAYTGAALRVRRSSDNAETDIGFTAAGDLDLDALTLHCLAPRRPLDAVAGAAAAYSLRRLRGAYTGAALRVRRSSDNAETDIGFTAAGDLDTTALLAFIGANSGFVTTWYDQSGNGRNATQATAANQPRIVNAGVIETAGERPIIVFDGVNDGLVASSWGAFAQPFTRSMVIRTPATIIANSQISNGAIGVPNTAEFYASSTTVSLFAGSISSPQPVTASERVIFTAVYNGASSLLVKNGSTGVFTNAGAQGFDGIRLAGFQGSGSFSATEFQEYVVFQSALSDANRLLFERSQAAYYGITHASPVSGFVRTWYDQSGFGFHAGQTVAANQPRIVNAGAVDTDGGRAAVRFLQASNTSVLLPLTGAFDASWSANIVVRTDPRATADWSDFIGTKTVLTGDGWFLRRGIGTGSGTLTANVSGAGISKNTPDISARNYPYRETVTLVRDTNLLSLFSLGVLAASDSTITAAMQPSEAAPVRIGGVTSRAHEGTVSELVIFSAGLPTVDRQTLERNQGNFYGITVA